MPEPQVAEARVCSACALTFPAGELSCPGCSRLVHTARLQELSEHARERTGAGEPAQALRAWREALMLLPAASRQASQVRARIDGLVAQGVAEATAGAEDTAAKPAMGKLAGLGALGLLVWKIKWLVPLLLTKGKFLLLGLTKMSTLLSMLASLGLYWTLWGWEFALGLVLSIYVHEIGHVVALHRLGIEASAPMFVPGVGAFIRSKAYPVTPAEDAAVGLAGPTWGIGVALCCYAAYLGTGIAMFGAIAKTGAWINIFNLLPVGGLDGSRGFGALTRKQRWLIVGLIALAYLHAGDGLLLLLGLTAAGVTAMGQGAAQPNRRVLLEFGALVIAGALLSQISVPTGG